MLLTFGTRGPIRGNHRPLGVILTVWLSFWLQQVSAQVSIVPHVRNAAVGQNVTLSVQFTGRFLSIIWYRGSEQNTDYQILSYFPVSPPEIVPGPQYTGREMVLAEGHLQITDLRTTDTGDYTVYMQTPTGPIGDTGQLRVYAPPSKPTLVNISGPAVRGDNFTLQCKHDELIDQYTFTKDNVTFTCDQQRTICSESSPVLHFNPIEESDRGNYTCTIYNPVGKNTSRALEIRVTVRISNVTLVSNVTTEHLWENETSVQLTCKAQGTDPTFSWTFNGSLLPQEHPRYQLSPDNSSLTISRVFRNETGPFVCEASNIANTVKSQPLSLNISWRPKEMIQCGAVESVDQIMLSCLWPEGNPPAKVQMQLSNKIDSSGPNEILENISRSNIEQGTNLTCRGDQEGLIQECYVPFDAPYAPGFSNGSVESFAQGGDVLLQVNLKSSSRASFVADLNTTFTWFDNSSSPIVSGDRYNVTSDRFSSQLTIPNSMEADSGNYLCQAQNFIGTTRFSFVVNVSFVPEPTTAPTTITSTVSNPSDSSNSGGLSAGAIAGIVVAVVALLVLIGVTVYCVLKKKKGKQLGNSNRSDSRNMPAETVYADVSKKPGARGASNGMVLQETPQQEEVIYTAPKFNNNQSAQPPADYPSAAETLYAQVKV